MPNPTVRELLLVRVDELVDKMSWLLKEVREVTDQLEPDRAQSCRVVLTMARVMLDEVPLRAATGPIDEPAG